MAVPILQGDVWQFRVGCKAGDQLALNTTYWRITSVPFAGQTDAALATALDLVFAPVYKGVISAGATYAYVQVQRNTPTPPTLPQVGAASQGVGTRAGDLLPRQVAGVLTWLTDFGGRAYRGRIYLPFPAEGDNDVGSAPTAGYMTQLVALANAYNNLTVVVVAGNNLSVEHVLVHKQGLLPPTPVTSYRANQKWGTQRRRGSYGRQNP